MSPPALAGEFGAKGVRASCVLESLIEGKKRKNKCLPLTTTFYLAHSIVLASL